MLSQASGLQTVGYLHSRIQWLYSSALEPWWMVVFIMQPVYSFTMALHSIHFTLPHMCPIPMFHMERLPMQHTSSHTACSSTSLIPWTTYDMKKSMINSLVVLTNWLLCLRVALCGRSWYTVNFHLTQNSLLLRVLWRMLFSGMCNGIGW